MVRPRSSAPMNKLSALLRGLVAAAGLVMLLGATGPAITSQRWKQA